MKLTKGKISKIINKKKQSVKKINNKKRRTSKNKTFRKKKSLNLANKTLKRIKYKKTKGGNENKLPVSKVSRSDSVKEDESSVNLENLNTTQTDKTVSEEEHDNDTKETDKEHEKDKKENEEDEEDEEDEEENEQSKEGKEEKDEQENEESEQSNESENVQPDEAKTSSNFEILDTTQSDEPENKESEQSNESENVQPDEAKSSSNFEILDTTQSNEQENKEGKEENEEKEDEDAIENEQSNESENVQHDEIKSEQVLNPEFNDISKIEPKEIITKNEPSESSLYEEEEKETPNVESQISSSNELPVEVSDSLNTVVNFLADKIAEKVSSSTSLKEFSGQQNAFESVNNAAKKINSSTGGKKKRTQKFRLTKKSKTHSRK
jgi:hypothetical protein